jgi:sarcosine oxidase subunit gamma
MLQALPPATRYVLRGGTAVRAAVETAFGIALPIDACRAVASGERAALWLGPDEWLLLAPEAQTSAVASALGAALAKLPHSLVDVSHRQCALSVSGPEAATLLAAGCPLDLDASAFPIGMCTRTVLAKAEVVLWRIGEQAFHIEVGRSFVAYVSQFLAEAAHGMT